VRTVTVDKDTYVIGALNCFEQFSVARRLAPMMATVFNTFSDIQPKLAVATDDDSKFSLIAEVAAGPLAEALATMKEEDVQHILTMCLAAVSKREGTTELSVYDRGSKRLRYSTLQMPAMINLVVNVIMDNLGSFFPTGQPSSNPE
jgi:hypothetical protein